jgi:hypothetical protein
MGCRFALTMAERGMAARYHAGEGIGRIVMSGATMMPCMEPLRLGAPPSALRQIVLHPNEQLIAVAEEAEVGERTRDHGVLEYELHFRLRS